MPFTICYCLSSRWSFKKLTCPNIDYNFLLLLFLLFSVFKPQIITLTWFNLFDSNCAPNKCYFLPFHQNKHLKQTNKIKLALTLENHHWDEWCASISSCKKNCPVRAHPFRMKSGLFSTVQVEWLNDDGGEYLCVNWCKWEFIRFSKSNV